MNKVFKNQKDKTPLTESQLKDIAGAWFTLDRIEGKHCECENENGEFILLDKNHPSVIEGGKDYMQCRICSGWSHL